MSTSSWTQPIVVVVAGLPVRAVPMTTSKAFQTQKAGIFWTLTDIPIWMAPLLKLNPLTVSPIPARKAALELVASVKAASRPVRGDRVGPPPVLCRTRSTRASGRWGGGRWRAPPLTHWRASAGRTALTRLIKLSLQVQKRAWLVSSVFFVLSVTFRDEMVKMALGHPGLEFCSWEKSLLSRQPLFLPSSNDFFF